MPDRDMQPAPAQQPDIPLRSIVDWVLEMRGPPTRPRGTADTPPPLSAELQTKLLIVGVCDGPLPISGII